MTALDVDGQDRKSVWTPSTCGSYCGTASHGWDFSNATHTSGAARNFKHRCWLLLFMQVNSVDIILVFAQSVYD